jgi:hypothetical protein
MEGAACGDDVSKFGDAGSSGGRCEYLLGNCEGIRYGQNPLQKLRKLDVSSGCRKILISRFHGHLIVAMLIRMTPRLHTSIAAVE